VRRLLLASIVLATLGAQHADAQIIRAPRFGARDPRLWVSGIVGLQQGFSLVDGTTTSRWNMSDATQYGAAVDYTITGGTSVGVRATTSSVPLRYVSTQLGGSAADADARVSQAFALLHVASGRGLHSVLELGLGATIYSDFHERGTGTTLPPDKADVDFAFVFGYGIGYSFSRAFQVDVVQDVGTSLHQKSGLSPGDDSSARIAGTRLVARYGFGG
jgi:hypothetical protein